MATNMTIEQAAQVVMGAEPTCAAQLDEARAVMFSASRQGYKFSTDNRRGSAAEPCIVITPPAANGMHSSTLFDAARMAHDAADLLHGQLASASAEQMGAVWAAMGRLRFAADDLEQMASDIADDSGEDDDAAAAEMHDKMLRRRVCCFGPNDIPF